MLKNVSNKSVFYMTCFLIAGLAIFLILNLVQIFSQPLNEKYLAYNDVKGMAVEYQGLLYTFNFDQQNQFLEYINRALPVSQAAISHDKTSLLFSKIVIYRFNQPDIVLKPIEIYDQNLLFLAPQLNPNGYIKDVTLGKLNQLIASAFAN